MNVIIVQILSLIGLFFSMLIVFMFPYWWVRLRPQLSVRSQYHTGLSFANCLSGGMFIAVFFIGLMPEVRYMFQQVRVAYELKTEFPATEFVIFLGFILALTIEQCVLCFRENATSHYLSVPSLEYSDELVKTDTGTDSCETKDGTDGNPMPLAMYDSSSVKVDEEDSLKDISVSAEIQSENHSSQRKGQSCGHGHSHSDIGQYLKGDAGLRLGLLVVSLGVHSFFEGLALGLQTTVSVLINLVIGVGSHELLVAFAMGVSVSRLKLPKAKMLKLAAVFSALIPFGQVVGLLIGQYPSAAATTVNAILQGLAAGTFIHVTFLEVIPAEFQEAGNRLLKVVFIAIGFTALLVTKLIIQSVVHEV